MDSRLCVSFPCLNYLYSGCSKWQSGHRGQCTILTNVPNGLIQCQRAQSYHTSTHKKKEGAGLDKIRFLVYHNSRLSSVESIMQCKYGDRSESCILCVSLRSSNQGSLNTITSAESFVVRLALGAVV
jgi:hypothetical protein